MNLKQCKDQIAQRMGFSNWKRFEIFVKPTPEIMDEAMQLYASEKVKEALQLAAERAMVKSTSTTKSEPAYYATLRSGTNIKVETDKQSILSLETELVNNIKNDK